MKIIFLDIDGVLNSIQTFKQQHKKETIKTNWIMSQDMCNKFNKIIKQTNAKIVISSIWRKLKSFKWLTKKLQIMGACKEEDVIDITPSRVDGHRGREIDRWFGLNNLIDKNIQNYLILDDNSDFIGNQLNHFVQTSCSKGLQDHHVQKAIKILKN